MTAPRGLHHLAIQVRDLAAAERFYRDTLGLRVLRRWPAADGTAERSVWLDTGDGSFLALERIPPSASASASASAIRANGDGNADADADADGHGGLHLVALRIGVGERGQWQQRLEQAGVPIYHRTSFTLYVRDPEGNRVGLSHYPAPEDGAGET